MSRPNSQDFYLEADDVGGSKQRLIAEGRETRIQNSESRIQNGGGREHSTFNSQPSTTLKAVRQIAGAGT